MGRIKGSHIKRLAKQLVEKTSLFSLDMKQNKLALIKLGILPSSKREEKQARREDGHAKQEERKAKREGRGANSGGDGNRANKRLKTIS